jgi:hypothetical protein
MKEWSLTYAVRGRRGRDRMEVAISAYHTPISAIFQLYRGCYWWRKPKVNDKLYYVFYFISIISRNERDSNSQR